MKTLWYEEIANWQTPESDRVVVAVNPVEIQELTKCLLEAFTRCAKEPTVPAHSPSLVSSRVQLGSSQQSDRLQVRVAPRRKRICSALLGFKESFSTIAAV